MGTQSKTTTEVLNDMSTTAIMKSTMSCVAQATQNQMLLLGNVAGTVNLTNVNLEQASTVDVSCLMTAEKQNEMAQNVSATLQQYAESQGEAALSALGKTSADVMSALKNKITSNVDASTETAIRAALNQNQTVKVVNVGENVIAANLTMSQQASEVSKAVVDSKAYSDVINSVANTVDQAAATKEINPIASIWGTVIGGVSDIVSGPGFIIIAVVAIGIIGVLLFIRSGGSVSSLMPTSSASPVAAPPPAASFVPTYTESVVGNRFSNLRRR